MTLGTSAYRPYGVAGLKRKVAPFLAGTRGHAGQKHSLRENHRQPLAMKGIQRYVNANEPLTFTDKLDLRRISPALKRFAAYAPAG